MSNSTNKKVINVNCPTCQTVVEWVERNEHRPFCSDRCRLIDLGAWAAEDYKIAGKPASEWDMADVTMGNEPTTLQ
ncbi:DNA gyrase inhibitor YacG [Alkalimarinus sediminis]|uniref:DNA gyrase inhibitor YacG n=1 Tax=Alkalimarinus sediminis TaxID=1632866 RepID=A0A9E8HPH7_9ALTE|nr:DNA gyrase inhibitor YacG [Alkalimarinus sediminis]UZW73454.1 DNA gyrase inhibitor YacG [Alkalimarinus sediminis]